jgi:hypothetical protein
MGEVTQRIAGLFATSATTKEIEETKRLWEELYDEPYERAGLLIDPSVAIARQVFNWEVVAPVEDINRVYKGLHARFLMEVCLVLSNNINLCFVITYY